MQWERKEVTAAVSEYLDTECCIKKVRNGIPLGRRRESEKSLLLLWRFERGEVQILVKKG